MIDYESAIFSSVATALRTAYPGINVESVENYSPSSFPFVSLVEISNSVYTPTRDSSHGENHAVVGFEANVYTNKTSGRKTEAKQIANSLDEAMTTLGFTRISYVSASLDDASKYRIVTRYNAIIDANGVIYRR